MSMWPPAPWKPWWMFQSRRSSAIGVAWSSTWRSTQRSRYSGWRSLGRTTITAADCCPRRSPPAACAGSSAAISRPASSPCAVRNAFAMFATTGAPARMFPWQANATPDSPPAQFWHFGPVHVTTRPADDDHRELPRVPVRVGSREAAHDLRGRHAAPRHGEHLRPVGGVHVGLRRDRGDPASAHGTTRPTAKYFDSTATPSSCVTLSYATIEKVAGCSMACAGAARTSSGSRTAARRTGVASKSPSSWPGIGTGAAV